MDRIVDIHNHLLPGVDDGSRDILESVKLINGLVELGVTDIVLTSHYIEDTKYNYNKLVRSKILENLKSQIDNDKVNLYIGNEVYLSHNVLKLLEDGEICTLNDTKYMLVELPLDSYLNDLQAILCDLTGSGIVPIIAHPERYHFLHKDKKRIRELLEFDCLLQCNIESLHGKYGKKAKKLMKWFLKNDLVQFVGTDMHHSIDDVALEDSYYRLKKIVGKDKFTDIVYNNPKKMLRNENVSSNLDYLMKEEKKRK